MRRALALFLLAVVLGACGAGAGSTGAGTAGAAASPAGPTCADQGSGFLVQVEQSSMLPTLGPGDVVLAVARPAVAGDIVVFRPPPDWTSDPTPFQKRVVGVGGDRIEIRGDGRVWRNGTALDEPYAMGSTTMPEQMAWDVPADTVFVLGDNRPRSADSRVFGPIREDAILGVVTWRCKPDPTLLAPGG